MKYVLRPTPVEAIQKAEPFHLDTMEGRIHGKAGDWLVTEPTGYEHIVTADDFKLAYVPHNEAIDAMVKAMVKAGPPVTVRTVREHASDASMNAHSARCRSEEGIDPTIPLVGAAWHIAIALALAGGET